MGLLDELFEAIIALDTEKKMESIIDRLAEHTTSHFATEERYFDEFKFEFSDDHKRRHKELLEKVTEFQSRFIEGNVNLASEKVEFLEEWMIDYIMQVDKKYVKCFEAHGLK